MQVEKVSISKLNPAKYNPRKDLKPGDTEYEKLKRSMAEFGYVEPIIWNKRTGNIVGGHQRYKILKDMKYKEAECVIVDLDDNREKALNVALNKISGEFDIPLLKEEIMFWKRVFDTCNKITGKSKLKTEKQIIKWLKNPHSDSAEYKLWGNGVVLPCVYFVIAGIVYFGNKQ